jgi:Zn-dependent protease with chaperone function
MHLGIDNGDVNPTLEMLGEAILFASIQFSIGSVEMSSKFSVKNFCSDQDTLQNAADALSDYLKISIIWTIGVILLLYSKYKWVGALAAIVSNLIVILWIYFSYMSAFKSAVNKTNTMKMPYINIFKSAAFNC